MCTGLLARKRVQEKWSSQVWTGEGCGADSRHPPAQDSHRSLAKEQATKKG